MPAREHRHKRSSFFIGPSAEWAGVKGERFGAVRAFLAGSISDTQVQYVLRRFDARHRQRHPVCFRQVSTHFGANVSDLILQLRCNRVAPVRHAACPDNIKIKGQSSARQQHVARRIDARDGWRGQPEERYFADVEDQFCSMRVIVLR